MYQFSSATLACLAKAGWYKGRKMPMVQYISYRACLLNEGYSWFPAVADFLEEFGGLSIQFNRNNYSETIRLDASEAASSVWLPDYYAPRIGRAQLCVLGQVYTDHLLLFMDEASNVYGGFDQFLCFVGSSGADAVEALCTNRPLPEIPE